MDGDEKLAALKKAYADIILGISKEAAARVMASEKKSVRFEHELKLAKDEGLRMLMRLKQMMDSQTSQAEEASLNQQKKIDELEAQLQEAEDIVSDLRGELQEVYSQLERVKNENSHQIKEPNDSCSREILMPVDKIYSHQPVEFLHPSDLAAPYMIQTNKCLKCYNKMVCTCSAYIGSRDLPSIISRGKDSGLYRNGCTQRIRACKRNRLDRSLSPTEETDILKINEEKESKEKSNATASDDKSESEPEKKLSDDVQPDYESFLKKWKRGVRRRKTVTPSGEKKTYLSSVSDPSLVKENAHSDENEMNIIEISGAKEIIEDEGVNMNGKMDVEIVDAPKGLSSLPVRERDFRYTFQRKRKRRALSKSEGNGSIETGKKTGDEKKGDQNLEKPKSSSSMESALDSTRLAQVAQQLISLSESKYWG